MDQFIGQLDQLGAIVAITADHGMNDKVNPDGSPKVQFLETLLSEAGFPEARVILPITDPYVVHHGALGSYATVYLGKEGVDRAREFLEKVPGVELVLKRADAADRFCLPPDRIGDLVVLGDRKHHPGPPAIVARSFSRRIGPSLARRAARTACPIHIQPAATAGLCR